MELKSGGSVEALAPCCVGAEANMYQWFTLVKYQKYRILRKVHIQEKTSARVFKDLPLRLASI